MRLFQPQFNPFVISLFQQDFNLFVITLFQPDFNLFVTTTNTYMALSVICVKRTNVNQWIDMQYTVHTAHIYWWLKYVNHWVPKSQCLLTFSPLEPGPPASPRGPTSPWEPKETSLELLYTAEYTVCVWSGCVYDAWVNGCALGTHVRIYRWWFRYVQ